MQANVDKYKHFEIDSTGQERLIEMWKYFNPKDEPVPISKYAIWLNDEHPEVSSHAFMEILKYQVFDGSCHKIDRWQVKTQNILTAEPVQMMYDAFIEIKSNKEWKPKKQAQMADNEDDDAPLSEKKPARKRK